MIATYHCPLSNETDHYKGRRNEIVAVASDLINERGVKGMTLADVGERVGVNVTYYFRRKELLAAACFRETLDRHAQLVADAA